MKVSTEQYFPVVLFIMLYKVVLNFESVDKILSDTTEMIACERRRISGCRDSLRRKITSAYPSGKTISVT